MGKSGVIVVMTVALATYAVSAACGSSDSNKKDSGIDSSGIRDSRPIDSPATTDGAIDGPPGTHPLTVKNALAWCSVSVDGAAASSAPVQTVNVQPGMIALTATALPNFKIDANMWHHTDGDIGSGETGTVTGTGSAAQSAVTATVNTTAKCVWVCCPFLSGGGCPTTDQCP
jgi:hypothetical protein